MDIALAIKQRRSIRSFTSDPVPTAQLREILAAGIRAPSGLNNQPWRFAIITDYDMRAKMADLTRYRRIILAAPALIVVFCNRDAMYNDIKDHQAIGACIQNMLLTIHGLGLGAVWLGEILKNAATVNSLLAIDTKNELMAVIALGYPADSGEPTMRQSLQQLVLYEK